LQTDSKRAEDSDRADLETVKSRKAKAKNRRAGFTLQGMGLYVISSCSGFSLCNLKFFMLFLTVSIHGFFIAKEFTKCK
ncbi:MAG: hypothetical protein QGG64_20435, partial [Candidatus Latescibacteria bacterium]|nr:hypothetical protein [Candidatus Latescibacterota bacterium]